MTLYLFGSRARGEARLLSDVDVFFTDDEPAPPREWLLCNGGPVDAFGMPAGDGWALPITENENDDRMLLCCDKHGLLVDPVEISWRALRVLVEQVQLARASKFGGTHETRIGV